MIKEQKEFEIVKNKFDEAWRYFSSDEFEHMKEVKRFLKRIKPKAIWEGVGIYSQKLKRNVAPDFVLIVGELPEMKVIACEIGANFKEKFDFYRDNNLPIFDEVWFFMNTLPYQLRNPSKTHNKKFVFFSVRDGKVIEFEEEKRIIEMTKGKRWDFLANCTTCGSKNDVSIEKGGMVIFKCPKCDTYVGWRSKWLRDYYYQYVAPKK